TKNSKTTSATASATPKRGSKPIATALAYLRPMLPANWQTYFTARRAGRYRGLSVVCPVCKALPDETCDDGLRRWRWLADDMTDDEQARLERLLEEHANLSHALQSGVRWEHERGSDDGSPKHLRTGVNIALRDHSSLVNLLVRKGIITDLEYAEAIVEGMR